jgi:hypothetical protein
MKKRDLIFGFILLALAIVTFVETSKLPIGSLSSPHVGFFPLIMAILLSILSLVLLWQTIRRKDINKAPVLLGSGGWKPLSLTVGFLVLFAIFFEYLGYLIDTFLLIVFLVGMSSTTRWWMAIIYGFAAAVACYLIFGLLLNAQLPGGLLERL